MNRQLIDETSRYRFERLQSNGAPMGDLELATRLSTIFVHKGKATLSLSSEGRIRNIGINEGQGFIVTPGISYRIGGENGMIAYMVSSETDPDKPIIEIVDDGRERREIELPKYKIIENPKRVDKPWGHELWVGWSRDYHVLKQIGMNEGDQSSLQVHRRKLETNYLESGQATVIDGYKLDPDAPEDEVKESSRGVDFDKFEKVMGPGDHWTSEPGTVHRVIAKTNYLAYEVSTPELADVIRIQDDSGRASGRIASEHGNGGGE